MVNILKELCIAYQCLFCVEECYFLDILIIWTPGLPDGVHSNRPCPSICLSVPLSVFKHLRHRSLVFLIFYMKLEDHKGTKVTEPDS